MNQRLFLGKWQCVYKLLLIGADANSQNKNGSSSLHLAIHRIHALGYKKDASYSNYTRVIEILLQSNANRHIENRDSESPIDLTHDKGNLENFNQNVQTTFSQKCSSISDTIKMFQHFRNVAQKGKFKLVSFGNEMNRSGRYIC